MCLYSVDKLNLKFDEKEQCFVGVGFKKLQYNIVDKTGRINPSLLSKVFDNCKKLENGWYESTGSRVDDNVNDSRLIYSTNGGLYYPGFHIFSSCLDAKNYYYNHGTLVKVMYSEVTGIGLNTTSISNKGRCIIAKYMKIIGKL